MNIFIDRDREILVERIRSLSPHSPRRWGTMNLEQALAHMSGQIALALGELKVAPIRSPAAWPGLKHLIIHLLPWPKGVATAPELVVTDAAEIETEREHLLALIDRVAARDPHESWAPHPGFGRLSGGSWGVLMARHLDHHLRQFSA